MALYADSPQFQNQPKSNFFTGSKGGFRNIPLLTQQQSGAQNQALQQAMQMLQSPGQSPTSQAAVNRFHTQTVPGLAERFASLGSGGSLRSSAFQGALGQAGAGLEQGLAAQEFQQLLPLLQLGLQPQFQTAHIPGQQGFLQRLVGSLGQLGAGALSGGLLGGFIPGIGGSGGALAGLLGNMGGGGGQGGGISDIIRLLMGGG